MKSVVFVFLVILFTSCNSSSGKKEKISIVDSTGKVINNDPGNISVLKIQPSELPAGITINGKVQEAWKWTDKLGENLLITSNISPYDDKVKNEFGEEGKTSEINAYHYAKTNRDFVQIWTMNDAVKGCPFDITNNFIPGSITVTDLDKNGIAEIKLQYLKACRSDVSPAELNLVIYEGEKKYRLTGLSWLAYSPDLKFDVTEANVNLEKSPKAKDESDEMLRTFGRYENEKEFSDTPPSFLQFARSEWIKFVKEKTGE